MSNGFCELTPAQRERLALLAEELGEAVQAIGKVLRHGYQSSHPDDPDTSNRDALEQELGDVQFAVELLCAADDLSETWIDRARVDKAQRVWAYLHHQRDAKRQYEKRWPHTMATIAPHESKGISS